MADKKGDDWLWLAIGGVITLGLALLGVKSSQQQPSSSISPSPSTPSHHPSSSSGNKPSVYHNNVSNISYGSSYRSRDGGCGCGL